jgi:hypothetical protein
VALASLAISNDVLGGSRPPPPPPPPPPNAAPQIVDFVAVQGITQWTFQGRVIDENPVGMVVTFGGILNGQNVVIQDPDGYFWIGADPDLVGDATAKTTDPLGAYSNLAVYYAR